MKCRPRSAGPIVVPLVAKTRSPGGIASSAYLNATVLIAGISSIERALIGAEAAVPAVVAVGSYSVILMAEDAYRERLEGRRFGPFDKAQNFLQD